MRGVAVLGEVLRRGGPCPEECGGRLRPGMVWRCGCGRLVVEWEGEPGGHCSRWRDRSAEGEAGRCEKCRAAFGLRVRLGGRWFPVRSAPGFVCEDGHRGVVLERRVGGLRVWYCARLVGPRLCSLRRVVEAPEGWRFGAPKGVWQWGEKTWKAVEAVAVLEEEGVPATASLVALLLGWRVGEASNALRRAALRKRPYLRVEEVDRVPFGPRVRAYRLTRAGGRFLWWARTRAGGPPPELEGGDRLERVLELAEGLYGSGEEGEEGEE